MAADKPHRSEPEVGLAEGPPRLQEDRLGLAALTLLVLLTLGVVQLYRSAPQSLAEAGARSLLVARPDAFAPRAARAEDLLLNAERQASSGEDSIAVQSFLAAEEQADRALQVADTGAARQQAVDLLARALLGRARIAGRTASERGLRPDDREGLATALLVVDSALALGPSAPVRTAGEGLRSELRRERRIGPFEWLPNRQ